MPFSLPEFRLRGKSGYTTYGGVSIAILPVEDLLTNKRAVGRKQDLLDVERLENPGTDDG
ncbi:MAG: hypothetical protein ABJE95_35120 [Byssovorax sp.]